MHWDPLIFCMTSLQKDMTNAFNAQGPDCMKIHGCNKFVFVLSTTIISKEYEFFAVSLRASVNHIPPNTARASHIRCPSFAHTLMPHVAKSSRLPYVKHCQVVGWEFSPVKQLWWQRLWCSQHLLQVITGDIYMAVSLSPCFMTFLNLSGQVFVL